MLDVSEEYTTVHRTFTVAARTYNVNVCSYSNQEQMKVKAHSSCSKLRFCAPRKHEGATEGTRSCCLNATL